MRTIIITHHNADLDALASMVAAARLYDGAVAVRGRSVNPMVRRFLALHKDHFPLVPYTEVDPAEVDRVVVVDVRDRRRLAEYEPILETDPELIIWDHHPASPHDLPGQELHIEPTGSCVTLLVERLRAEGVELTPTEATLFLLGVYTDTGSLSFDNTTPRDVDVVGYLLRQGGNLRVVLRYLQEEFSLPQRTMLVSMLASVHEVSVDAVEVAIATAEAPRFVRGASAVVHRVMQLGGHDAIFGVLHFVKDRRVQVIGRSRVPYVNMGTLLQSIGGGGHPGAAAATLKKADPEEVVAKLQALLTEASLRPTRVSDIMTAPVQTIPHDATMEDLAALLDRFRIRGVPVLRDNTLCGIISVRDLERARKGGDLTLPVAAMMSHQVQTIPLDEPLEDALTLMTEHDIGRLPVVDDEHRIIGIVSRTDMIARMYSEA